MKLTWTLAMIAVAAFALLVAINPDVSTLWEEGVPAYLTEVTPRERARIEASLPPEPLEEFPTPVLLLPAGEAKWQEIGKLPSGRANPGLVQHGGNYYLVGGVRGSEVIDEILVTTDFIEWKKVASLPTPGINRGVFLRGDQICIVPEGGSLMLYNLRTGEWSEESWAPEGYVLGNMSISKGNLYEVDWGRSRVIQVGEIGGVSCSGLTLIDDRVIIVGGADREFVHVHSLSIATMMIQPLPCLKEGRNDSAVLSTPRGLIVAGGYAV